MVEKPKRREDAPSNLIISGRYILQPEIFEPLSRFERGAGNEIQLTDAMARLLGRVPFHAVTTHCERYDCGGSKGNTVAANQFAEQVSCAGRTGLHRFVREMAPDIGSVKMARAYAKRLNADLALVDKRRPKADSVEVMNIIGDVEGKNAVMFDDVVTTGATMAGSMPPMRWNKSATCLCLMRVCAA